MLVLDIALGVAFGIGLAALIYHYRAGIVRTLKSAFRYAVALALINLAIFATWNMPDWKRWIMWLGFGVVAIIIGLMRWKPTTSRP
jgi:hypothetical protein